MNKFPEWKPSNFAPFMPVLKADAAKLLRVCTKTIDNYILQGLLPKPKRFGMREMWHPDVFYAQFGSVLLGAGLKALLNQIGPVGLDAVELVKTEMAL